MLTTYAKFDKVVCGSLYELNLVELDFVWNPCDLRHAKHMVTLPSICDDEDTIIIVFIRPSAQEQERKHIYLCEKIFTSQRHNLN
jgi:hypothetical protein